MDAETKPQPGQHGYRVSPPRFCADCSKDVSEGCHCHAPTRDKNDVTRCNPCWHKHIVAERERAKSLNPEALLDLYDALSNLVDLVEMDSSFMDPSEADSYAALITARAAIAKATVTP